MPKKKTVRAKKAKAKPKEHPRARSVRRARQHEREHLYEAYTIVAVAGLSSLEPAAGSPSWVAARAHDIADAMMLQRKQRLKRKK